MPIRIHTKIFCIVAASGTGCTTVSAGVIGGSCSRSYILSKAVLKFFFFSAGKSVEGHFWVIYVLTIT